MVLRKNMMNYILSIGFIFITVLFLTALFGITRFVLADADSVQSHVISTRDLLEDIERVEQAAQKVNETPVLIPRTFIDLNSSYASLNSSSLRNVANSKGVAAFKFNQPLLQEGDLYYFAVSDIDKLSKGQLVLYSNSLEEGLFVSFEEDDLEVYLYLVTEDRYVRVPQSEIRGVVFFRE